MKKILLSLLIVTLSGLITAQTTAIPDANFEQALINKGLDVTLDGLVLTANIDTLTNLDVSSQNISDLTGIEDFIALTFLNCINNSLANLSVTQNTALTALICKNNQLTSLNVTQNTALLGLLCDNNQLSSIDVTQNPALVNLTCSFNLLTSVDITQNPALVTLDCENNQLTTLDVTQHTVLTDLQCSGNLLISLDVTQNTALIDLSCFDNQITSLDVTQNTALFRLICPDNQLNNLDVTQNTDLYYLNCWGNLLTSLDVTQNTILTDLLCYNNQLTSLNITQNNVLVNLQCQNNQLTIIDASQNTLMTDIQCNNNQLTCLNVRNGKNYTMSSSDFNALGNPSLTCVEVDDSLDSFMSWLNVETWTSFSNNCNNACSNSQCNVAANFTYSIDSIGNYIFFNTSIGNYNKVHWAFGDGTTSTTINPTHTFSTNGTFMVVLTVNDSAKGSSCFDFYLDTFVVTSVLSPPQCTSGFVMYPDTTTGDVTVINSSTGTNLTYLWDFGDGNTSNLQNPSYTYATSGPFYLCLTVDDGAGCINMYCDSIGVNGVVFKQAGFTINVISPISTGIGNEITSNSTIAIYPNPTTNKLSIINDDLTIDNIAILDITGKTIKLIKQNTKTIDVSSLSNGIYFIRLITDGRTITKKFVKQ